MAESNAEIDLPKLGVLGGTFDPIHNGHLIIAQVLLEKLDLARVLFLLSAHPPHKSSSGLASWQDRFQMIQLALHGNPHFQASDIEIKRNGPSYTVETIEQLQLRYGKKYSILFIVGADSILEIFTWREPRRLLASGSLVVVPRPGFDLKHLDPLVTEQVMVVQTPLIEISSTDIRRRVRQELSIRYLVPSKVASYIHKRNLYR